MADESDRPDRPELPELPDPWPEDDAAPKPAPDDDPPRGDTRVPARRPARAEGQGGGGEVKSRGWFSDDDDEKPKPEAARAEVGDEPGWLDRLSKTLTDLATDISSITVRTYTADDVGAAVSNHREIGQVGELRAWTRIAIDGDTDVCVPVRKGKVDQTLWALHQTVVEQAQTHRTEMLKALIDSVSGLWLTKK